ncbi:MAG: hypothetical protein GWP04_00175 [Gammaproteobacteria bacterium]|nr:hypothetical protein [Gammaproteobacteria bacterium]
MNRLVVERSALRMWLLSLLGVPFILVGLDLLAEQHFINAFGALVYGAEQIPAFEPRDEIFAIVSVLAGLAMVIWGLRDLVLPRKLIVADEAGLRIALRGPLRRAVSIPWNEVGDLRAEMADEDGEVRSVLVVEISDPEGLPTDPWSARWEGPATLMIESSGWSQSAKSVAAALREIRESIPTESERTS